MSEQKKLSAAAVRAAERIHQRETGVLRRTPETDALAAIINAEIQPLIEALAMLLYQSGGEWYVKTDEAAIDRAAYVLVHARGRV